LIESVFPNFSELVEPLVDLFHFINLKLIIDLPALRLFVRSSHSDKMRKCLDIDCRKSYQSVSAMALGVNACKAISAMIARLVGSAMA